MVATPHVLVAGAGRRVFRSILPALAGAGVAYRDVTLLSRRKSEGHVAGIRHVNSIEPLRNEHFDWTLNCVSAEAMPVVQNSLCDTFPSARHFCDTPSNASPPTIHALRKLANEQPISSLEDWPLLPNFQAARATITGEIGRVTISHFGIPTHFLSLCRSLATRKMLMAKIPRRLEIVGTGFRGTQIFPKDFNRASAIWIGTSGRLVDYFSLIGDGVDQDRLVRRIGANYVAYHSRSRAIFEQQFEPELIAHFGTIETRQDIHEFEKAVALNSLFRSAMNANGNGKYQFIDTLRDVEDCASALRWRLWFSGPLSSAVGQADQVD